MFREKRCAWVLLCGLSLSVFSEAYAVDQEGPKLDSSNISAAVLKNNGRSLKPAVISDKEIIADVLMANELTQAKENRLGDLKVDIGGSLQSYFHGQLIYLLPTQSAKIVSAQLKSGESAMNINLVGFRGREAGGINSDVGVEFTSEDLIEKWSLDERNSLYKIEIKGKDKVSGLVFLKLVRPVFEYAEVFINGKRSIIRDQTLLTLNSSDNLRIGMIKTNIYDHDKISYKIVKLIEDNEPKSTYASNANGLGMPALEPGKPGNPEFEYFKLVFFLQKFPLATFPLRISQK